MIEENLIYESKNLDKVEDKLLHYARKAIRQFSLIEPGDKVLACLSGGKDSYTMLCLLKQIRLDMRAQFELTVFVLDQGQPGWDDRAMRDWLTQQGFHFIIMNQDTFSIVKEKIPENQTYCSLCSRLRRGIIYRYARENGYSKIALGHHRDDLIQSLMMSILYNGRIASMPPKLRSDDKQCILIRPLVYCQERDIIEYARLRAFPIIPCNLCGSQENLIRKRVKRLIEDLEKENPKIPSNILHALQSVQPSQLMDAQWWNFKDLQAEEMAEAPPVEAN